MTASRAATPLLVGAGLLLLVVAARVLALDVGHPWVMLATAFPYVVPLAAAVLLAAALLRARAATAVAAVALLGAITVLAPRALPGPAPDEPPTGPEITVVAANLYFGRGDLAVLTDLVEASDADVMVVVELTEPARQQLEAGAVGAAMPHAVGRTSRWAAGSAIWSRHPLTTRGEVQLNGGFAMPIVDVAVPGAAPLELTGVHPWPPVGRDEVRLWETAFDNMPRPGDDRVRVLAGDFNASLDHRRMRELLADGYVDAGDATGRGLVPTYRGISDPVPPITIDHVLVDERVEVLAYEVHDLPGSDHDVVVARLRLPSAAQPADARGAGT